MIKLSERQADAYERLSNAMLALAGNQNFHVFMEAIHENREGAVRYMVNSTTQKDQREALAAAGEVRCYDTIEYAFRTHLQSAFNRREKEAELQEMERGGAV